MIVKHYRISNKNSEPLFEIITEKYTYKYNKIKRQQNPAIKINDAIRSGIYYSLKEKKNRQKWESLVGYTLKELIKHLKTKFKKGMTIKNFGRWHIDHIIAKSKFYFISPIDSQFKKCWALNNLQPLWAHENFTKGCK